MQGPGMHVVPLKVDLCTSPQHCARTQGRSWISWSIGKVMMWAKWTIYLIVQLPSRRSTMWTWIIVQLLILRLSEEAALSPPPPMFPGIIKEKANFIANTMSADVLSGRLSGAVGTLKAVACFGMTEGKRIRFNLAVLFVLVWRTSQFFIHCIISGSSSQCKTPIPFKAMTSAAFMTCGIFWNIEYVYVVFSEFRKHRHV